MPQYTVTIPLDHAQNVLDSQDPNCALRLDAGCYRDLYVPRSAVSGSPESLTITGPVFEVWPHNTQQQIGSTHAVVENGNGVIEIKSN